MIEPETPPPATARLRRRHHRVSSALWYFRGDIDDYRQTPGWDPLSPKREQYLLRLLRWTRLCGKTTSPTPNAVSSRT